MSDDADTGSDSLPEPQSSEKQFSLWGYLAYGIARIVLKRIPNSARSAAVFDTPEYQKLQGVADELCDDATDMREQVYDFEDAADDANRRANRLEDVLSGTEERLKHAQEMKIAAEARSKEAWTARREMGEKLVSTKKDLDEARAELEAKITYFDEILSEKVAGAIAPHSKKVTDLSRDVRLTSAVVSRLEAMELLYHDSLDLVPSLVLCVDRNHGVAKASAGFKKRFGVGDDYFEVPLPEDVQQSTRPVNSRQSLMGKPLAEIIDNPEILEKFSEYADYFFPQLWKEPHFTMVVDLNVNGKQQKYMANARILKKPVTYRDSGRQETRFVYAGARLQLEKVSNRMMRNLGDAVASLFFKSRIAYSSPEGVVIADDIDRAVRESSKALLADEREYPVLVDFTNAESVEPEAVKKVVEFYEFYRRNGASERYFIVPSRFRGQFFDAGLPPRGMLLPETYKKEKAKPLPDLGLATEQA